MRNFTKNFQEQPYSVRQHALRLCLLFAFLALGGKSWALTYYSQGSLAPSTIANWNTVRLGGGTSPANFTAGDTFVIQNGHNMTTSAVWSISGTGSKLQIESGGTLTATFAVTLATVTTFQIDNGGSYVHSSGAGSMTTTIFQGTESFGATSNFTYTTLASVWVAPASPGYGNLTINAPSNAASSGCGGVLTQVQGNLTITNMGNAGGLRLALVAAAGNSTLNVGGNLILNGANGNFYLSSGNSSAVVNVTGDVIVSAGKLDLSSAATGGAGTLNIGGNFNQTGGTVLATSSNASTINFTGSGKTFTQSAGTLTTTNMNWTVASAASLTLNNALTIATGKTLTVAATGLLATNAKLTSTGTTTINGTFQLNQGSWATGSNFVYDAAGTLAFNNTSGSYGVNNIDVFWPTASGPFNVSVIAAGGITMNAARTVAGTFQTAAGVAGANKITANGALQINMGGYLTGTPTYGASSTLVYNTTSYTTTDNEFPVSGVKNVTLTAPSGTNTVTFNNDKIITGTLNVGSNIISGGKSINAGTITIGTGTMTMRNITTSTALTCSGASAINLSGSWSVTGFTKSTSTVNFTGTGNFSNATNFYNLTNSGGTRTLLQNMDVENTLLVSGGDMRTSGARNLTMSGSNATINITTGSITGTDVGIGNDLTLIISGAKTTLTGNATSNNDHEKKFFNVTVNNGSTLVLARGILCRYGTFAVNGTLQIDANGYVQIGSGVPEWVFPTYNASTGALVYNNNGACEQAGEWPTSNSPFNVTIQNSSAVTLSGARAALGTIAIGFGSTLNLGTYTSTTGSLSLNAIGTGSGSFGHTSSAASFKDATYFGNNTGILNVSTGSCAASSAVMSGGATLCLGGNTDISVVVTGGVSPYTVVHTGGTVTGYVSANPINVSPSSTTNYTITSVTDAYGCTTSNSGNANVIVDATTVGGAVTGGTTICSGSTSGTLTLAGHTGSIVRWEYAVSPFTSWTTISNTNDTYTSGALTATTQFRAVVQNGSCLEAGSATTTVTVGGTTTWNGSAWSNSAPTSTSTAIIAGDYNVAANITACSLTVTSGTVVIPSGYNVTLNSALTVSGGTFTLNNNANLIQNTEDANSGSITVKRDASMRRLDYTYWSSPVASQNLLDFSPQTLTNRFYTFNESSNAFNAVADPSATNFAIAKGYSIRASNFLPPAGTVVTVNSQFDGVPNNGTKTIAVAYSGSGKGYNLIGNPYPSTIDANAFLNYSGNEGTLYFWTHYVQQAGASNYATFNNSGGTAGANGITPNGTIQVGQGFIYAKTAAGTATFTNAMRVGNNSNQFFKNSTTALERHRIWLNLSNATTVYNQTLVGYIEGATQGIDAGIDGTILETGTTISSRINNENYVIQGRALPFDATDLVPLSFSAATADSYTLNIDHVDGLFSGSQTVYLKDNLLGTTHDIKANPYTFTSDAGTFNNRFEIVYTSSPLAVHTPTFDANSVIVYKQNEAISINAGATVMASIKVFDIRGRLLFENKAVNATTTTIKNLKAEQQMLLVQITSNDARVVTKKIVY